MAKSKVISSSSRDGSAGQGAGGDERKDNGRGNDKRFHQAPGKPVFDGVKKEKKRLEEKMVALAKYCDALERSNDTLREQLDRIKAEIQAHKTTQAHNTTQPRTALDDATTSFSSMSLVITRGPRSENSSSRAEESNSDNNSTDANNDLSKKPETKKNTPRG
jgi:hypothetical protein